MKIHGIFSPGLLKSLSCLLAALGLAGYSSHAAPGREDDTEKEVREAIADTVYVIDVDRAYPVGHGSIVLDHSYSVTVEKDSLVSRLPFFGRAYSIPYGGGDGLMFEAKLKDYTCRDGKRGRKEIGFTADTDEDHFEFRLTVFPDGSSSVSVVSTNRQQISYGGTLSKIKKSDKKR